MMRREGKSDEQIREYLSLKDEHFCKWEMAEAKIKLRLNPKEHHKLLAALQALSELPKFRQHHDSNVTEAVVNCVVNETQMVLKSEWRRVKRGEPVFVATKIISLTILVGALLLGIAYTRNYLHIDLLPDPPLLAPST